MAWHGPFFEAKLYQRLSNFFSNFSEPFFENFEKQNLPKKSNFFLKKTRSRLGKSRFLKSEPESESDKMAGSEKLWCRVVSSSVE
jgi:hypothetical protein